MTQRRRQDEKFNVENQRSAGRSPPLQPSLSTLPGRLEITTATMKKIPFARSRFTAMLPA
jgi:hypothetical protein